MIKNILDFVEVHNKKNCKVDEFDPILNYSVEKYVNNPWLTDFKYNNEYRIRAEIGTLFYAHPELYNQTLREAKANMLRCIYGDIIDAIGVIRSYAYGGNKKAVIDGLNEIEEALTRIP